MQPLKILFSGLANAGKTSILKILDNRFEEIPDLAPTMGIAHSVYKVLGLSINLWDMGGQTSYRQKYLLKFEENFQRTECIILHHRRAS